MPGASHAAASQQHPIGEFWSRPTTLTSKVVTFSSQLMTGRSQKLMLTFDLKLKKRTIFFKDAVEGILLQRECPQIPRLSTHQPSRCTT